MTTQQATTQDVPGSCGSDICQLPAHEMQARREMIERDLLSKASRSVDLADGRAWEWEFGAVEGLRGRLEELVTFERGCCPGLRWDVSSIGDSGAVRLEIGGLPPDHPFWSQDQANAAASDTASSSWRRAAKAVGLGGGVSFLVCCVLPVGAAALFGAAVAAPFAALDTPLFMGVGSLAAAVPAWLWLRRRETRRRELESGCAC